MLRRVSRPWNRTTISTVPRRVQPRHRGCPHRCAVAMSPPEDASALLVTNSIARGGRVLSPKCQGASSSVTRSPDSQPCGLRAGRGGPTPPAAPWHLDATRPTSVGESAAPTINERSAESDIALRESLRRTVTDLARERGGSSVTHQGGSGAGAEDGVDGGLEFAGGFGEAGADARHGGLVGLEAALEEIGLTLGL